MKKIGIFTYFQTNYGAVLQAFALQHYLQNQPEVDAEIVDFTTPYHLNAYKIFRKYDGHNPIKALAYYFVTGLRYFQMKRRLDRTWDFKKKYFKFSRRYSTVEDVLQNHPIEDIYITGSDQVFNPNDGYASVYFLGFNKGQGKKVAYAPSFGVSEFNDEITGKIINYINDFDYLSCREKVGADYLSSITGRNVLQVVDPVLLHDAKEWSSVAAKPKYKKDYIFVYDLNGGDLLLSIAKSIQKHMGLAVVCLTANKTHFYKVNKQIYDAGPAEFIGWIQNAKYVVTDSFHGTVFSLIFGRQFYSYIANERTSSRIINLLTMAGLKKRIITKNQVEGFDHAVYMDLEKNNQIEETCLNEMSDSSKAYIKQFLS